MSQIVKRPLVTEKAVNPIETKNQIVFVVDPRADKQQIKKEVEQRFNAKVKKIKTMKTIQGEKKAYVTFEAEKAASQVAAKLKIL